jgi:hypothetical protein
LPYSVFSDGKGRGKQVFCQLIEEFFFRIP